MSTHLGDEWLDSCVGELNLPGSPWYEVKEKISKYLVERIRVEGLTSDEVEKVRFLLGSEFSSKYKLRENEAKGTDNAKAPTSKDERLESLLKDLTLKAANDAGCHLGIDSSQSPERFQSLVNLASKIFRSSLETHMNKSRMSQYTHYGSNPTVLAVNSLVSKEIEILGEAVVRILQKDPGRLPNVQARLRGRLMPSKLRRLLYRMVLITKQKRSQPPGQSSRQPQKSLSTQQEMRAAFAKGVKAGMDAMNLKSPAKCPLRHLIEMSVIEAYETLPGLQPHSSNMELQREAARVLNILYTYSKNFQKNGAVWLFPLQVTISEDRYAKEHEYELAMWLDSVVKSCFPATARFTNTICVRVWKKLMQENISTSSGQTSIVQHFETLGIRCKPEEVVRILELELPHKQSTTDLKKVLSATSTTAASMSRSSIYSEDGDSFVSQKSYWSISHPILCIRKWLEELFVSVTDLPVCMFIWDQFFLHNWEGDVFDIACLVLFKSVLDKILAQTNADDLCSVMLGEPVYVQLHQIHKLWNGVAK